MILCEAFDRRSLALIFLGLPYILPEESMIKAIDVWEVMCITLVFAGMLEFALMHAMLMRRKQIKAAKELEEKLKGDVQDMETEHMVNVVIFIAPASGMAQYRDPVFRPFVHPSVYQQLRPP